MEEMDKDVAALKESVKSIEDSINMTLNQANNPMWPNSKVYGRNEGM